MSNIKVTIKKERGETISPVYSTIFPADKVKVFERGGETWVYHYLPDGNIEQYVVSETLAGIQTAIENAVSESGYKRVQKASLDATSGVSIGTVNLTNPDTGQDAEIPDNAIVVNSYYVVETTFTSSTDAATIALGIDTDDAGGIVAAVAISDGGNPWDAANHDGVQDGAAANFSVQTTAKRALTADVATEALTAGKLTLFVEYIVV